MGLRGPSEAATMRPIRPLLAGAATAAATAAADTCTHMPHKRQGCISTSGMHALHVHTVRTNKGCGSVEFNFQFNWALACWSKMHSKAGWSCMQLTDEAKVQQYAGHRPIPPRRAQLTPAPAGQPLPQGRLSMMTDARKLNTPPLHYEP